MSHSQWFIANELSFLTFTSQDKKILKWAAQAFFKKTYNNCNIKCKTKCYFVLFENVKQNEILYFLYYKDLEKQEDLRDCFVLLTVTQLWAVTKWVSRAPPHHNLPAFLNLNGRQIVAIIASWDIKISFHDFTGCNFRTEKQGNLNIKTTELSKK